MNKKNLKNLIANLPINPDILGRNKFFNSAVLILLVKKKGEFHILFEKRAANIRQGGDICFPGGGFEAKKDKNFKETALRETYEELGIKKQNINILGQLDTYISPIGTIIEIYVGTVEKKILKKMKLDKNEVEKTLLIPISFFKKTKPQEYTLSHEVQPYKINKDGTKTILFPVDKLGLPKIYKKPWGNKEHKVSLYKYKDEVIWGITSVIIQDLLEKY